jgi:hypothetical protein
VKKIASFAVLVLIVVCAVAVAGALIPNPPALFVTIADVGARMEGVPDLGAGAVFDLILIAVVSTMWFFDAFLLSLTHRLVHIVSVWFLDGPRFQRSPPDNDKFKWVGALIITWVVSYGMVRAFP